MLGGDDFGIVAYVRNDTAKPLYVRNNSNDMSAVVVVPPRVLGSTGFTQPGEPITWFDAKCHRLGHVAAPNQQAFLVVISADNAATIESIDPSASEKAVGLEDAENAPMACFGVNP